MKKDLLPITREAHKAAETATAGRVLTSGPLIGTRSGQARVTPISPKESRSFAGSRLSR